MTPARGAAHLDLVLRSHVDAPGDTPAFTFVRDGASRTYSRAELYAVVDAIAAAVHATWSSLGHDDGQRLVAILTPTQEEQVLHVLGVLAAGLVPAVLTPPHRKLDEESYARGMAHTLTQVAPALVLTDLDDVLARHAGADAPATAGLRDAALVRTGPSCCPLPADTAFVQFSSGTTGLKKGVHVAADAVVSQLRAYSEALALRPTRADADGRTLAGDCIVSWLPLYHDMGFVTGLHLALFAGVHVVHIDTLDWLGGPVALPRRVSQHRATLTWQPNFALAYLAQRCRASAVADLQLDSLRAVVNCSEPATWSAQEALLREWEPAGLRADVFTGCYAMAESTFALTHGPGAHEHGLDGDGPASDSRLAARLPLVPVGAPLAGVEVEVVDGDGCPLPDRTVGELRVRAPFLAAGYVGGAPVADADGWYRTGDLGYRADGHLYVTGRSKDLIIVNGHNVFPEDIERIVGERPGFRSGRVAAFADRDDDAPSERVVVLAEREDGAEPDAAGARADVLAQLGVALRLHVVEPGTVVKSSSGKVARTETAARWRSRLEPAVAR
jgi:fatty-acyl-CoA synthase